MKNISLDDPMYDILEFIYQQQEMKLMVTFKKLGKELSISKSTVAKRVKFLEQNGLILTVKIGRSKSISLTDQGEAIIKQSKKELNRFT
jgi:DNA-binding MarR family transcriptional regulator